MNLNQLNATSKKHSTKQVKVYAVTQMRSLIVVANNKDQAFKLAAKHGDFNCDAKSSGEIRIKQLLIGNEECLTGHFNYINAAGEFIPKNKPSK